MSYHHSNPGPLPNRWLYCPRNGSGIIAERFLPFKTPLSARFAAQMPDECQFEPPMVFSFVKMHKQRLGLWIDLTNTSRFYDRREVEMQGAQYHKMQCRGHGETPTPEQTNAFVELVDRFVRQQPLDIIGVHCTHGFNRTGFLIVAYMVERLDCSVEAALAEFARIRPPGIYKADYIRELFRRYEDEEDASDAPLMPDWCNDIPPAEPPANQLAVGVGTSRKRSFNSSFGPGLDDPDNDVLDDEDEVYRSNGSSSAIDDEDAVISPSDSGIISSHSAASASDSGSGGRSGHKTSSTSSSDSEQQATPPSTSTPAKKRRKQFLNLNATFMAGVQGVQLVTDQPRLDELQECVQRLCGWTGRGFPGSQPVSMDLENMQLLQRHPYRVSWKADGTRYMMLVRRRGEVYFFDRDNSCFQVQGVTFPRRKDLNDHLRDTVLDGEMVIDKVDGLTIPRYLVYDVVQFDGYNIGQKSFFPRRLDCMQNELIWPRNEAMRHGLIRKDREPFSLRMKDFWEVTQARALLGPKFARSLLHEPDGLIFQPSLMPYTCGPCKEVLKWKPAELNSVDFKVKIVEESGLGIVSRKIACLYVGQHDQPFAQMKCTKVLRELNGKIIECKFENNQWVFMRERTDKSFPNSYNTAIAVCHSIKYPVTTDILLNLIDTQRYGKDDDIMPPPRLPQHIATGSGHCSGSISGSNNGSSGR